MSQPTFHPSVNARVNKLGKRYEKLQAAAFHTIKDIAVFCERNGPIFKKFMAYNDQLLHLLKEEKIPESLLKQQIDTSDAMAALGRRFTPMFSELVYSTKPKIDSIVDFGKTLERDLIALHALRLQKEASEALTSQLEQQTDTLARLHTEVRQLLNECVSAVQEMQATLKRSLN
jgi:organic radical activating enzyme